MNEFPKRFMTVKELSEMGFPKSALVTWSHIMGAPVIRTTARRGRIIYDTSRLFPFLSEHGLTREMEGGCYGKAKK